MRGLPSLLAIGVALTLVAAPAAPATSPGDAGTPVLKGAARRSASFVFALQTPSAPAQPDDTPTPPTGNWSDLARIGMGFILTTVGSASLALAAVHWRLGGVALLSFGLLAFLYGAGFLIGAPLLAPLFGFSRRTLLYVTAVANYSLPIPGLMYAEQVRGPGWHSSLRRGWQVSIPVVAGFIAYDVAVGTPFASNRYYGLFIIVVMAILLPHVIFWTQRDPVESRARTLGTGVLVLVVIHDILAGFGVLPWSVSLQVYGVGVFLLSLGFVTTRQLFANQRELAAVDLEMATARSIQTSILPREVPKTVGLDVAVRYVPVRSVAGDAYGFLSVDEHRIGVLVADVTGHGVPAALISSMTTAVFASLSDHADDPGYVLSHLNRALVGRFDAQFVTAAYVYLDARRGVLRYSLAGHPYPLLRSAATGQVVRLTTGGVMLGVMGNQSYPVGECRFGPGDRLVLFTDGMTDVARPSGDWFGDRELGAFSQSHEAETAGGFATDLLAHLERWSGRTATNHAAEDDLTLVVIQGVPAA